MSILEVKDVSIRYMTGDFKDIGLKEYVMRKLKGNYHIQEFWADRNITFSLEKGDMLGIIGTNGAGKSTLLKAVSGIMEPTKGWVKREGNIAALLELASGFDGDLTVRENAYLRGAMLGYTRKFMDDTYDQIIDFAELQDFQDRPFKQLSSGMKSRLAFSIASLVQPDILILDEVLSVGDGAFRRKSERKMREIITGGATTILVSHSIAQIREMCNKVLWLDRGRQVMFGDNVEEICDEYQAFLERGKSPGRWAGEGEPRLTGTVLGEPSKREKALKYLGIYTLLFTITFLMAYSPFLKEGKTLIWLWDAREQNYPVLIYVGQYLRQIVLNLLHGKIEIPLFDLNLAMGGDIIGPLNYFGFGNPLYLLSALVPIHYTEYLYDALLVLRIYLAGLSFFALCGYHKKPLDHAMAGALIYAFSGYTIYTAVLFPYFIEPMIQLPLLLIGIDQVMRRKKTTVFIFSVFYSALCGFYFFYMMTLMLGAYVLIRFFDYYSTERLKEFVRMAGRIIRAYMLGIGLSAPIFVPAVTAFCSSSRLAAAERRINLFYDWSYYRNNFLRLIAPTASWDAFAMAALILPAIILLFAQKKRYRSLKLLLAVCLCVYILPIGGSVMNGFSYPINRWTFGAALLLSYIAVEMLPILLKLDSKQQIICVWSLLIYSACIFIGSSNRNVYYVVGVAMLAMTVLMLVLAGNISGSPGWKNAGIFACILMVMINVSVNAVYKFAKDQGNYINEFVKNGEETERLESALEREAEPLLYKSDGRFDSSSFNRNVGAVWHVPTMTTYWSVTNNNIILFYQETENVDQGYNGFNIEGTDRRTVCNALFSTKYFIEKADQTQYVPYGYTLLNETTTGNLVYENQYALPWGYTYDSYLPYNAVEQLNGLQVEEAMLQQILLEETIESIPVGSVNSSVQNLPFEILESKDIEWKDGVLHVDKDNTVMTINFQMPAKVEGYLRLKGFDVSELGQSKIRIDTKCGNTRNIVRATPPAWYSRRENYLINLGYSEEKRTSCTLNFPKKGTYKLADIQLFALPMDKYPEQIKALRAEPLENIAFETNRITGTIDLSKSKILCVSIPYSSGWTARVDGKKVDILRGNYMFMALPLEAGYHEIEFTYFTPGLGAGLACCVVSVGILAYCAVREKRKKASGTADTLGR